MAMKTSSRRPREFSRCWQRINQVLRESLAKFYAEDSLSVAASIAYYSLLSIFPLLLLLLGLCGLFIRRYELSGHLTVVLGSYLPMKADFIMRNLVGVSRAYGRVGLVSFLLLLWGSSGVFLPLEKALNRAWAVERERSWLRRRLVALEMALIVSFLILVSSVLVGVNVYIHARMRQWAFPHAVPLVELVYHTLILAGTFGSTLAMFVVLLERLPNRHMRFREIFPSALLTAIFWEAARSLFTLLLPLFNYHHIYGSIGAVVALMTWAYISSAVMLFGARVSASLYRSLSASLPGELPTRSPAAQAAGDTR